MKSVLSKSCCEKKEKPYPKLMWKPHTGSVWLMQKARTGMCVHAAGSYVQGEYVKVLDMSFLEDYEGDVCLTNEEP